MTITTNFSGHHLALNIVLQTINYSYQMIQNMLLLQQLVDRSRQEGEWDILNRILGREICLWMNRSYNILQQVCNVYSVVQYMCIIYVLNNTYLSLHVIYTTVHVPNAYYIPVIVLTLPLTLMYTLYIYRYARSLQNLCRKTILVSSFTQLTSYL